MDRTGAPPFTPSAGPVEPATVLARRVRPGDAVLTGASDPVSLIIQTGSRSPYSHIGIVVGPGRLIEAYDYALTPDETDEGIFSITLDEFIGRCGRLRDIEVRRPRAIATDRLVDAARHLELHSPGFPTLGMGCLALCGLSEPLLRVLPDERRRRLTGAQARLAADGAWAMHCAETATRLYYAAGLPLRFRRPRLWAHIQAIAAERPPWHLVDLPTERRRADAGRWPSGLGLGPFAAGSTARALRDRARTPGPVDVADLILPGDFARADPFHTVARLRRRRGRWTEHPPTRGSEDRAGYSC